MIWHHSPKPAMLPRSRNTPASVCTSSTTSAAAGMVVVVVGTAVVVVVGAGSWLEDADATGSSPVAIHPRATAMHPATTTATVRTYVASRKRVGSDGSAMSSPRTR